MVICASEWPIINNVPDGYRHTDCKPDSLWSNHLLKAVFLQKTHYFLSAQSPLHFPEPLHPAYPQIPYVSEDDTTLIKLRQRCSKPAVQVLYCFICIHAALSPFRIFYINSASCRTLFSQITILNHIQQDSSGSTMFYI